MHHAYNRTPLATGASISTNTSNPAIAAVRGTTVLFMQFARAGLMMQLI